MIVLAIVIVLLASPVDAAQPALETVRIGIPGKLVDFSPFYVGIKTGIYRSEGLEPQFIVMRSGIIIPALLSGELARDAVLLCHKQTEAVITGKVVKV